MLPLTISSLTYLDEVNYDDKKFYEYDLNFCLDMIFDSLTIYDQIYLKILYKSGASIKILLGSITLYNYSLNEEVFYTNLKGVTSKHNNNMILSNVLVKFNTQSQIEIVDIKTLNSKVSVDLEYSEVVDYIDENSTPIMDFIAAEMPQIKDSGATWGFDVPYMLTGALNIHPSSAIKFIKEGRTDYSDFYKELLEDN